MTLVPTDAAMAPAISASQAIVAAAARRSPAAVARSARNDVPAAPTPSPMAA